MASRSAHPAVVVHAGTDARLVLRPGPGPGGPGVDLTAATETLVRAALLAGEPARTGAGPAGLGPADATRAVGPLGMLAVQGDLVVLVAGGTITPQEVLRLVAVALPLVLG